MKQVTRSNRLLGYALAGCVLVIALFELAGDSVFGIPKLKDEIGRMPTDDAVMEFVTSRKEFAVAAATLDAGVRQAIEQAAFSSRLMEIPASVDPRLLLDARVRRTETQNRNWAWSKGMQLDADFKALAGKEVTIASLPLRLKRLAVADRVIRLAADAGIGKLIIKNPSRGTRLPAGQLRLALSGTERSVRLFLTSLADRGNLLAVRELEMTIEGGRGDVVRITTMTVGPVNLARATGGVGR